MTEATRSGRRRSIIGGAAAGVLVLLTVAIVIAVHTTDSGGAPLPTVSPYPKDYVAPFERLLHAAGDPFPDDLARFGRFVDTSHGFLAVDRCLRRRPQGEQDACHRAIMVTNDGGATITELTSPA